MRTTTLAIAAVAALTLAACNRDEPETPMTEDAAAATDSGSDAAASAATGASASGTTGGAMSAETMDAAGSSAMTDTSAQAPGAVTQADRDAAKMRAEETNLHPQTN